MQKLDLQRRMPATLQVLKMPFHLYLLVIHHHINDYQMRIDRQLIHMQERMIRMLMSVQMAYHSQHHIQPAENR